MDANEERELFAEEARVKLAAAAKRVRTAQGLAAVNRVIGENARDYVARVRSQGGIVVNFDFLDHPDVNVGRLIKEELERRFGDEARIQLVAVYPIHWLCI